MVAGGLSAPVLCVRRITDRRCSAGLTTGSTLKSAARLAVRSPVGNKKKQPLVCTALVYTSGGRGLAHAERRTARTHSRETTIQLQRRLG